MILDIDLGNTRGKWRLRTANSIYRRGVLDTAKGIEIALLHFYRDLALADVTLEKILVSSVLDAERNAQLYDFFVEHAAITPSFAKSTLSWGRMKNGYDIPEALGVDRWLAMMAAFYENNTACIVIDCGTAITVDIINGEGHHLGGFIAPGFNVLHQALFNNTAIPMALVQNEYSLLPGKNTAAAIQNARLAMLSGLIQHAELSLVCTTNEVAPAIIATGGDAPYVQKIRTNALLKPELVLDGLALFFGGPVPRDDGQVMRGDRQ